MIAVRTAEIRMPAEIEEDAKEGTFSKTNSMTFFQKKQPIVLERGRSQYFNNVHTSELTARRLSGTKRKERPGSSGSGHRIRKKRHLRDIM